MVLTASAAHRAHTAPVRGTTLPTDAHLINDDDDVDNANANRRAARAHTLPSYALRTDLANSRAVAVSVLSLHSSDNEAINFENG